MIKILRLHWHWTAGGPDILPEESDSYNYIFRWPDGKCVSCVPDKNQIPPLLNGAYAAHTRGANSRALGLSMDGMALAKERPFDAGKYPITEEQVNALVEKSAFLNRKYGIAVTRSTNLSHAEVETTLKIKQRQKWDIMWLPGMDKPGNAIEVGDFLRKKVSALM